MIKSIRANSSAKTIGLLTLFVLAEIMVGFSIVYLPYYWITLLLGLVVFVIVASYPMVGVTLMLVSLYFPILPTVPLGPLEFSASTLPAVGLTLGIFFRNRFQQERLHLAGWQKIFLLLLALAFLLSTLFSSDYASTFRMVPNMLIYLLIIFGIMAQVNTFNKIQYVAKVIIILAFLLSIWRVELRPLRILVGLPSLGINGAAFTFHPGVALALVVVLFTPKTAFSLRWRWFAGLTVASLLIHGVRYETRAAWLAWAIMLLVLFSCVNWQRWLRFMPVILIVAAVSVAVYGTRIELNYAETSTTILAAFGKSNYSTITPDDRLRLLARDAGLRMFQARPIFGWGANRFDFLKPIFVGESSKEADYPGAFDSWLILLAEMGLVGVAVGVIVSLAPLGISWLLILRKQKSEAAILAFGFSLGVLGLAIHLLFIDLMFSFYWIHVALALSALALATEKKLVQEMA